MISTWLPSKVKLLLAALCVSLAFQSCTKEVDAVLPAQSSTSDAMGTPPPPCESVCLVAGQRTYVGSVDVALDADFLYVTYNITKPNVFLLETHLDIFNDVADLRNAKKLSNGGAIPGKFAYKKSWNAGSRITSYTATIPRAVVNALGGNDCFKIAAHAALSNGETAWGGVCSETSTGVSLNNAEQFPGSNWGVYFQFCKEACVGLVDFTYAWEDLRNTGNDADYNDLVIKSSVTKSSTMMEIKFIASARGAGYDHAFKFNIPKAGVTNIFGADSFQDMGTYYTVTVFPSTKLALPAAPGSPTGFANTSPLEPCVAATTRTVKLILDGNFPPYNPAKPYEPFISVFTSGSASSGAPDYNLNIYGVSVNGDTWSAANGQLYPNGILIPSDWKWPKEAVPITDAYPTFTSLTAGFNPNWAASGPVAGTFSTCN